ncbi:PREDICTED: coiled-coil domain-containing protein 108 [Cyprinodon variegatus]|uniref:coiled-coil domain-containing protein 108 n=1 Tax=Cyprinodon variegatus TaxID=28743 RepID=UPI0007428463|nr:PREDICTED: coiled-coil domain-containing protein 108 [Cyprinodon variegatus]
MQQPPLQEPHLSDRKHYRRKFSGTKKSFFGLETRPELLWEDWVVGKEYTKTMVLRNVCNKLQKLRIRAPASNFFSIINPEIAVLSPGTSFSLPVTFRPLQRCEYKDRIQFQAKEGSFQIHLHAVPPHFELKVPETVMLPHCAVQHATKTRFPLKNASKVVLYFKWDCWAPFKLTPENGLLKPGEECLIFVDFQPLEAKVFQQQAHCRFGEDGEKMDSFCTVLLQGIGKYPYLQLHNPSIKDKKSQVEPELHFGSVAIGQSLSKNLQISNPSPVNVCFSLSRLSGGSEMFEPDFSWNITSGKMAPGESLKVTVTYSPAMVDIVSVEYLCLNCKGALNKPRVKLTGKSVGPNVCLSSSVVDFGYVEEKGSAVKTVELLNSSPAQAIYQWDIDCKNSVFTVLPASGTLNPHGHIKVKVLYKPTHPIAHHRKVACLILHKKPLFLDLMGTCHSEPQQPAILKNSSESVCDQQKLHNTKLNRQGDLDTASVILDTPTDNDNEISLEHMDPLSSPSLPFVTIEPSELLFNHKTTSSFSSSSDISRFVSVANRSKTKLCLVWTVIQDSPFSVAPSFFELAPLKSTTVCVTYEPKQINTLHGGELECFVYKKDPNAEQHVPCLPRCMTVRVIGHSFQPEKERFTPCCILKPHQVVFPPLKAISCRTVLLQNNGDQPLTFCLDHTSNNALPKSVQIFPACGLIPPEKHQIITIRTVPTEDSPKQGYNIPLQLNAAKVKKELNVVSVLEKPNVSLESGNTLYFHPTAVGCRTQHPHSIRNLSCLPIKFQWCISEAEQQLISVEPDAGELHPNESLVQMWSFSPVAKKTYTLKPTLSFWSNESDKMHLTLELIGKASAVSIEAVKEVLDVGEILVGSCHLVDIPIVNKSPCPIYFRLSVQQMLREHLPNFEDNSALQLDCETGTIASHSTFFLQSTLRLCTKAQYFWAISYQIVNASGSSLSRPQNLCEVQAKGVYPTLQVMDACSSGSMARLSKQYLWKLFSLDNLNEHLLSMPSPAEVSYKIPTRHSLDNSPSIFSEVMLDFNFGAAPLNSDPSDFMLMFVNPGSIPAEWTFLFPEDQQMELEDWALADYTDLLPVKISDKQLFRVSPRSGTLLPGQKKAVRFTYSHDFIGTNQLSVLFKLNFGSEILLKFEGVTVDQNEPYIHFASNNHTFRSIAIGDSSPPQQMYELYNSGAVAVHYEVDQAVLSQLQMDNYNHPVLRCLSPQGDIPPGNKATLEWIFSPLEAKMYHMDVPIHIQGRDSKVIKFEGCGINASSNLVQCNDKKELFVQKMPFPGQVAFLSEDTVVLGHIPVYTTSSRIIFLTSLSNADTLHYLWEIPTQHNKQVLQIQPERGCLGPGEFALCVLTYVSHYPSVDQLDLICQVTRQAALVQYQHELKRWEAEKKRQEDEFIITDKRASDFQRVLVDEISLTPPARKEKPLIKYKTLPPISGSNSSKTAGILYPKQTRAEKRLQREAAKVWRRPKPPEPALLHLSVTAHSHDCLDYFTHFPDQYKKHHRSQGIVLDSSGQNLPAELFSSSPPIGREILVDVLTTLYKNLLDDAALAEFLMALASKPPPYQAHIATCPPSILPSSPQHSVLMNSTVDGARVAECLEAIPLNQTPPGSLHVPADLTDCVLLNTLQNIMMEAVRGELVLTAHPHSIMLPPRSMRSRQALAEED